MKKTLEKELSLTLFLDYIQNNYSELEKVSGDCNSCCIKGKCDRAKRIERIHGILATDLSDTRFPMLLSVIKKIPFVLYLIPKWVFQRWSGYNNNSLGCPTVGIVNHVEEIIKCYNSLNDELSKQTYIAVLMYRVSYDAKYLSRIYSKDTEYFEIFKNLSSDEVVVDCGAYTGDTLEQYLKYNSIPQKYICYEPDKHSYKKLVSVIEKLGGGYVRLGYCQKCRNCG